MAKIIPVNHATKDIHSDLTQIRKIVDTDDAMKYDSDKYTVIALFDSINKNLTELDEHLNHRDEMDSHDHGSVDD